MPDIQSAEAAIASKNHRESADNYRGELFRHGDYRVAECRDRLQWLLQRRRPRVSPGGAAWDTVAYCSTRKALRALHRKHTGSVSDLIDGLPSHIARANRT